MALSSGVRLGVALLLALAAAAGCGRANPLGRKALSGRITLDGEPLANGSIEFAPQTADGVGSGAEVVQGSYAIEEANGLPEGTYLVRVYAVRGFDGPRPNLPPGPSTAPAGRDLIPPEYNSRSEKTIVVTADGPNQFDFDIEGLSAGKGVR